MKLNLWVWSCEDKSNWLRFQELRGRLRQTGIMFQEKGFGLRKLSMKWSIQRLPGSME